MTESQDINRRDFLKAAAASAAIAASHGPAMAGEVAGTLKAPTEAQKAKKKKGDSTVGLIKCPSYEDNIFEHIKPYISQLGLPDLHGKKVVLKPNMVECHPGHPITTHPEALKAAVELVSYLGASEITIAEGAGHMRDTEYLLEASGLGPMTARLGLPFVDLNLDDLEKVPNPDNFSGLEFFYLPRTIVHADAVISVPKMKAHHWVGATCSMKNLFGTVPGRKYGWPKNTLHIQGIPNCIIDLVHLIQPKFAFVDAIIAMEGDGPINGTAKHMGFVAIGTDLAAVDATCFRTMLVEPLDGSKTRIPLTELTYLQRAGQVVGNIDEAHIKVVGASVKELAQPFAMPITYKDKGLLAESDKSAS